MTIASDLFPTVNPTTPVAAGYVLVTLIPPDIYAGPAPDDERQYDLVPLGWQATLTYTDGFPNSFTLTLLIPAIFHAKYQFSDHVWISHFQDRVPTDPFTAIYVQYDSRPLDTLTIGDITRN
jgi:hypothetical protein